MPLSISQTTKAIVLIRKMSASPCYMPLPVSTHSSWRATPMDRNSAFDYFTGEYRRMLEENLDQYREMFGQLKYQHLMPDRAN